MGVPDEIVPHGDPKILLAEYGLDADGIYQKVSKTLESMRGRSAGTLGEVEREIEKRPDGREPDGTGRKPEIV